MNFNLIQRKRIKCSQLENLYHIFKSSGVGSYLVNKLDKVVIPNISFIDELTNKEVALSKIKKVVL